MCSSSKVKFLSWCQRPSWIYPSWGKCRDFWEGHSCDLFNKKVPGSRISHKNIAEIGHGIEVLNCVKLILYNLGVPLFNVMSLGKRLPLDL